MPVELELDAAETGAAVADAVVAGAVGVWVPTAASCSALGLAAGEAIA